MATLARMQNPIGPPGKQWCPGGRQMANAVGAAAPLPLLLLLGGRPPGVRILAAAAARVVSVAAHQALAPRGV